MNKRDKAQLNSAAYISGFEDGRRVSAVELNRLSAEVEKQRKPLTDEEIVDLWADVSIDYDDQINIIEMARAIERAHGIGGEA